MPKFKSKSPHYEFLRKKWVQKHQNVANKFMETHSQTLKHITLGGMGALTLLSTPAVAALPVTHTSNVDGNTLTFAPDPSQVLAKSLQGQVPDEMRTLNPEEEAKISQTLSQDLNMNITPSIDGLRLNRSYGMIGGEQHLYRFPGDTVFKHADTTSDWSMYGDAGIAPGLGAWGYFAPSESQMTPQDKERERWYIAVQTFLAPGFSENVAKYRDFFRYRKMLVVNPKTGQAVVADIADAGPSEWTGKHLGGSPEVMQYLGLAGGPRKGAVLYFFIDDPNNQVPLGPVSMKTGIKTEQI